MIAHPLSSHRLDADHPPSIRIPRSRPAVRRAPCRCSGAVIVRDHRSRGRPRCGSARHPSPPNAARSHLCPWPLRSATPCARPAQRNRSTRCVVAGTRRPDVRSSSQGTGNCPLSLAGNFTTLDDDLLPGQGPREPANPTEESAYRERADRLYTDPIQQLTEGDVRSVSASSTITHVAPTRPPTDRARAEASRWW